MSPDGNSHEHDKQTPHAHEVRATTTQVQRPSLRRTPMSAAQTTAAADGHDHVAAHGHDAMHDHAVRMNTGTTSTPAIRWRCSGEKFWMALLLTIPAMIWGEMIPRALGFTPPSHSPGLVDSARIRLARLLLRRLGIPPGRVARDRRPPARDDDADLARHLGGVRLQRRGDLRRGGMPLWWELSSLVTIMLLGHWMEMRSISQAQGALQELAKLLPEHGDAHCRRTHRGGPDRRFARRRSGVRATRRSHACRRHGPRRTQLGERIDDHGRVAI